MENGKNKKKEVVTASVKSMEIKKIVEKEIFCDEDGLLYRHSFSAKKIYVVDGEAFAMCPKHWCLISVTLQKAVRL